MVEHPHVQLILHALLRCLHQRVAGRGVQPQRRATLLPIGGVQTLNHVVERHSVVPGQVRQQASEDTEIGHDLRRQPVDKKVNEQTGTTPPPPPPLRDDTIHIAHSCGPPS